METFFTVVAILSLCYTLYLLQDTISDFLSGGKSFLPGEMKDTSYRR